ncbi:hypothetical protein H107_04586 [Trichophyton rubrum CBS 202.88]|nr:hypothetical protein H100_04472 [Trichophyton rubrum MR850]EZF41815.1 hypothetical protein H102_04455 [Trichophyton rubrum CBS 100081]EZF84398.1 hypothetical protein H110_04458 [Trichophyton rubrum MR1448]EZG16640.1 hypothetical protein H107_04586 [Trichophyton rubrum CBS 202.88]
MSTKNSEPVKGEGTEEGNDRTGTKGLYWGINEHITAFKARITTVNQIFADSSQPAWLTGEENESWVEHLSRRGNSKGCWLEGILFPPSDCGRSTVQQEVIDRKK